MTTDATGRVETAEETVQELFGSIFARDFDAIVSKFSTSDDAFLYSEGPDWSTKGRENISQVWRNYLNAPFHFTKADWIDGPIAIEAGELAFVAGLVELHLANAGLKRIRLRMTWVLRMEGGRWKIFHEHDSQPVERPFG